MMKLIDPDDGVLVRPDRRRHVMAVLPLLVMITVGLAVYLWPPQKFDVAPLVRPPVTEAGSAVPQTITSVAQGQVVGDEAYWMGFRLNQGWHLAPAGDYGHYGLVASVTNQTDTPDVARVLVTIRVGERDSDLLMCMSELGPGETKPLSCAKTSHAAYTSRWSRITLSAV
jgi:hypothetical protein